MKAQKSTATRGHKKEKAKVLIFIIHINNKIIAK
jgi:hypothetical protein